MTHERSTKSLQQSPLLCLCVVLSMKISNYLQHYGLRRIRLPEGRFEKVRPRHSWSANRRFSNWMFYNMQRHPDHHAAASRPYALLQHYGEDESPQLPGSYATMFNLVLVPRRWFALMDPLVDQWRAHFYPGIDDWSAYDSRLSQARPEAFDAIIEIFGTSPRLARLIERNPKLLDSLQSKEFTDLDLPPGFGPDREFEASARSGLTRLYWTREFGTAEMKEQIGEIPVQDAAEATDTVRSWSNDKAFQIAMHTLRGNLSPVEMMTALSNVAEASVAAVLSAVEEDFIERSGLTGGGGVDGSGGVAAVFLGDLSSGEVAPGAGMDILLVHDDDPVDHHDRLCRHFLESLHVLSQENLLFAPLPPEWGENAVHSLAAFAQRTGGGVDLTRARCVFTCGDGAITERFDEARRKILVHGADAPPVARSAAPDAPAPDLASFDDAKGGFHAVEGAARFVQSAHAQTVPEILDVGAASVFRISRERGLFPDATAEQLEDAARMWRNLYGICRLVVGDRAETVASRGRAVIARSCGMEDFDALSAAIRDTAAHAGSAIDALDRVPGPGSSRPS